MSEPLIRGDMIWGLMSARGDIEASFRKLRDAGGNARRWFAFYNEDDNEILPVPYPFAPATWINPGKLCDSPAFDHDVPIFEIGAVIDGNAILPLTAEWKEKLSYIAYLHAKYEIAPIICMSDRCSKSLDAWQQFNDWAYSNTLVFPEWQTPEKLVYIDPATGEKGLHRHLAAGDKAVELLPFQRAIAEYIYSVFKNAGCRNIYADPENEYGYETGQAWTDADMVGWLQKQVDMLFRVGFTPIVSIRPDMKYSWVKDMLTFVDVHNIKDEGFALPPEIPVSKIVVNSDGTDGDWEPEASVWPAHSLSREQARRMGRDAYIRGCAGGIMIFQEASDDAVLAQNVNAIAAWPALSEFCQGLGYIPTPPPEYVTREVCVETRLLANKPYCPTVTQSFVKGTEPTTTCAVHKAPEPPTPQTCWEKYMADRPIRKWQVGEYLKCLLNKLLG